MTLSETAWRWEEFGHFKNAEDGIEMGLPLRWEKTPRWLLGYIPVWPFTRFPWQTMKAIYRVRLNMEHPLTFVCGKRFMELDLPEGTQLQICKVLDSDLGSVPIMLQPVYAKDSFPCSFIYHDARYVRAGLWTLLPGTQKWWFEKMTRLEVDTMLMLMFGAEGGNAIDRGLIFQAVHLAGGPTWSRHPGR